MNIESNSQMNIESNSINYIIFNLFTYSQTITLFCTQKRLQQSKLGEM